MRLRTPKALLFRYIDQFASVMASEYLTEHDRWVTSAAAERAELVRSILDDQPVSVQDASATLGYPLGRHHLAAVLWHDPGAAAHGDLLRAAARLMAGSGCTETLVIPFGASSAWVGRRGAPAT